MKLKSQNQMNVKVLEEQLQKLEKKYCKTVEEKKKMVQIQDVIQQMTKQKEKMLKSFHIKLNRSNFNPKTDCTKMKNILAEISKKQKINRKKIYQFKEAKKNMLMNEIKIDDIQHTQDDSEQENEIKNELYSNQILQNKKIQITKDIAVLNKNIQIFKIQLRQIEFSDNKCQDIQQKQQFNFLALQNHYLYIEKKKQRSDSQKIRKIQRKKEKKLSIKTKIDNNEYEIYVINIKKSNLKKTVKEQKDKILELNQYFLKIENKLQHSLIYIDQFQKLKNFMISLEKDKTFQGFSTNFQQYQTKSQQNGSYNELQNSQGSQEIKYMQFFKDYFRFLIQRLQKKQNDIHYQQSKKSLLQKSIVELKFNKQIFDKFSKENLKQQFNMKNSKLTQKLSKIENQIQFFYELNMSIYLYQERVNNIFEAIKQICQLLEYDIQNFDQIKIEQNYLNTSFQPQLTQNNQIQDHLNCQISSYTNIYDQTLQSFGGFAYFFKKFMHFTKKLLVAKIQKNEYQQDSCKRKSINKRRDSKIIIRPQCSIQDKDDPSNHINQFDIAQRDQSQNLKQKKAFQTQFNKKFTHINNLNKKYDKKKSDEISLEFGLHRQFIRKKIFKQFIQFKQEVQQTINEKQIILIVEKVLASGTYSKQE